MIEVFLRLFVNMLRRKGKVSFIKSLKKKASLLDVGCGNNAPLICKTLRPDIYYVGIDVGDYQHNNNPSKVADEYILTSPDLFSDSIANLKNRFDAVISSHNLEHCIVPNPTLLSMLRALKIGGRIYLSFPCEASISFPRRRGLNFFDDSSHKYVPKLSNVLEIIKSEGFEINFVAGRSRSKFLACIGLLLEPISIVCRKVMIGTWELYGFESVIWATKTVSTSD